MPTFRTFKNGDPPILRELWNDLPQHSRGCGWLAGCDHLEQFIFSKPYFDPNGLHIAFSGDMPIGFSLAGFAADADGSGLDRSIGVVCLLAVHPAHRRKGVATELLKLSRAYLHEKGAKVQYLGARSPFNPFGLGLYGGADSPGILESDEAAIKFAEARGGVVVDTTDILQLQLDGDFERLDDHRLPILRRSARIYSESFPEMDTWWQAATVGATFCYRFDLVDGEDETPVGAALVWDMDTFSTAWNVRAFGFSEFLIAPSCRRKGFAKLFLQSILKHLRDNRVGVMEIHIDTKNEAARQLLDGFRFTQIDVGHMYRLPPMG